YSLAPESQAFLISKTTGALAGFFGSILPVTASRWLRLSDIVHRKPALRSEAFARALIDAKACLNDSETLLALFNDAAKKAAAVPREPFKEYWAYLQTMLRLVRAHHRGEYDQIPDNALLWIVAALNYLIDPFDLIPDATP